MTRQLALRLVWRDLKASPHLLWIVAALALGVATLAAVGTAREAVLAALERDAAVLLGGDVALETTGAAIPFEERAAVVPDDARSSDVVRTNTILRSAAGEELTVALKGVDDAYPLYGALRLDPPLPLDEALAERGIVVAPGVLSRLGVALGDRLAIGEATFTLRAVLVAEPDRTGGAFQIGPRVIVRLGDLEAADILREGSVARYATRLALPPEADPERFVAGLRARLPDARFQAETAAAAQPGLERLVGRLATFLTLASLAALATGGLGIALATRTHLQGKLATMATLRALGGRPAWVATLYGGQIALLGLVGVALGVMLGALLPLALAWVPASLLPVRVENAFAPWALGAAGLIGALVLAAFAWLPLATARRVAPASLFRGGAELAAARPTPADRLAVAGLAAALVALVLATTDDARLGGIVIAAVAAGTLLLLGLVLVLQHLAGRLARIAPPRLRLPLKEIARPGGETTSVVLALALGLALLTLVGQTGRVIDAELGRRVPERAPSTVFIDIQPSMRGAFERTIADHPDAEILQIAPYLRARLVRIAGVPVAEAVIGEGAAWTVRSDRGITWSALPPPAERLVAGSWWPADHTGPLFVAIEDEAAAAYGVGVGDTLTFNVLGRVVDAEIRAIRPEIDWSRGRLEFLFTFSPGLLENAPHSFIAAVDVPSDTRPALLDALSEATPSVTPLLIDEALAAAADVLERIRAAIMVVAGLTLASGLVVLAAGLAAVRTRQRYAAAILKALGARRGDLARTFLVEHAALGGVAAGAGLALGLVGAWLVAVLAIDLPFVAAPGVVAAILALGLGLTTATGLIGLARLVAQPAQPLLRAG